MKVQYSTSTINQPMLLPLATGEKLKIYEVSGSSGMVMPKHHSTGEAVVIVKSGEAALIFRDRRLDLHKGDSFLIPAEKPHKLILKGNFRAIVVMPEDSHIEFE